MSKRPVISISVEAKSDYHLKLALKKAYDLSKEGVQIYDQSSDGYHLYFTMTYPIGTPDRVEFIDGQLHEIYRSSMNVR